MTDQRLFTAPVPFVRDDGTRATRYTMQRACNGCGFSLGDATDAEGETAADGLPLPDVRDECPDCKPSRPLSVGAAIIALVPGAEGAGVKP